MTRIVPMLLALLMAVANPTAQAIAEEAVWPQRVIRVILTAAPGSVGDTVARIVTQRLAERLGQQFVIVGSRRHGRMRGFGPFGAGRLHHRHGYNQHSWHREHFQPEPALRSDQGFRANFDAR